jgi:hypothetical protein
MNVTRIFAAAVAVLVIVIGGFALSASRSDRDASGRFSMGSGERVAMSSPVDPDAAFFWELPDEPESLIPLDEIVSGGPPPDGIPAIDAPSFETVEEASTWLEGNEPVLAFELDGDARAYPIQILTWHEIVNDVVGGEPVSVTFCPLCNSAIVFSREAGDLVLDFGTSGRLWRSDLVMYDRQTKSLWPQIEGRAVVGSLLGTELQVLPATMVSWDEWRSAHPEGQVLSRDTGFDRPYGNNPYVGYDDPDGNPFLFDGPVDGRLPAMERVLAIELDGEAKAYPFGLLARERKTVVHDRVGDTDVVVFFERGTSSALDAPRISTGRDVGATGAFRPSIDGDDLTFEVRDGAFVDTQTGTRWSLLGTAIEGPLQGAELDPVPHIDTFWFAWGAFQPDTAIWEP